MKNVDYNSLNYNNSLNNNSLNNSLNNNFVYESPRIEVIKLVIEKGFALSGMGSGENPFPE